MIIVFLLATSVSIIISMVMRRGTIREMVGALSSENQKNLMICARTSTVI